METTHILCQHNYALTPLPGPALPCILQGMDYDLFLKRLGAEILRRRKAKKWNQIQFAEAVNTDQGSISRIENGKQGFDSPLLFRIAKAFDTLPGELCSVAVDTPLPEGIPADAVELAQAWNRLQPDTRDVIKTIAKLDLKAKPDTEVDRKSVV